MPNREIVAWNDALHNSIVRKIRMNSPNSATNRNNMGRRIVRLFRTGILTLVSTGIVSCGAIVIDVSRFGLQPDLGQDSVVAVRNALAKAREESGKGNAVRLVFPKGRYDFFAEDSENREYFESNSYARDTRVCPIIIEGMANLVLDGQGSEFVFHGPMQPITVDRSRNILLRDFSVDWDIPLTAQAQIMAATDDYIDIRIAGESPYVIKNGKIVFQGENWESGWWGTIEFERDSHLIPQGSGDGCLGGNWRDYRAEELEPHLLRLHNSFARRPAVGNYLVMRHNSREHAGMFFFHSKDVVLEEIDVYHTGGLGLLGQFSENLRFEGVHVVPNPRKNRYLAGHDDGIHLSNCRGMMQIRDCVFGGLMDDPINVHGTSVRVMEQPSVDRLICRFSHSMSVGQLWGRPGESIGFLCASNLKTIGKGTIKSWKPLSVTDFEISFEEAVPAGLVVGDALENLTWSPRVRISHCTFNSCRARGVLLSTPRESIIEDSVFRSSGAAILIAGDANQWYESGAVTDLLIRNNIFESPCLSSWYQFGEGIISIFPEIPEVDPAAPFHSNIRIENNVFHAFDYPVLYALSTDDISFRDNTIIRNYDRQPWHWNKNMLNFTACRNVRIQGTRLVGDVLGRDIKLRTMAPGELVVSPGQDLNIVE
jgi:hypothetical protein